MGCGFVLFRTVLYPETINDIQKCFKILHNKIPWVVRFRLLLKNQTQLVPGVHLCGTCIAMYILTNVLENMFTSKKNRQKTRRETLRGFRFQL